MKGTLFTFFSLCILICRPGNLCAGGDTMPDGADYRITSFFPGGDVLHPDRTKPSNFKWYLGLDAGITYSLFQNGPLSYYLPNPYYPGYTPFSLQATMEKGSGLGFTLGGALDFGISDDFGVVLKLNYHTRKGSFDQTTNLGDIHPDTQTGLTNVFQDKTDLTFTYFGIDLLARIQIQKHGWYVLIGPAFGSLLKNNAKLDQFIIQPDDIYYQEAKYPLNPTQNKLRTASSEAEINGFKSSRVDLKFGVGTWIEISNKLYLTPELTLAYPLTTLVEAAAVDNGSLSETAAVFQRYNSNLVMVKPNNKDFNMMTMFLTIGLRWQLN